MRTNVRCSRTARLTREAIPLQRRSPRFVHARLVMEIQRDMQAHAHGDSQQLSSANAKHEDGQQSRGTVEDARRRVLGRVGLVEEADRRPGTPPALSQTEPQVVVRVDEHASRPDVQRAAAKPWARQRRTRRGDGDVISHAHHTPAGR
jgi:hypothetical protein